jgi:hypothetical protein
LETRRQRQTSERTFDQLRKEHGSRYEAHVIAAPCTHKTGGEYGNQVNGVEVELMNLGRGSATKVRVEAFAVDGGGQAHYFAGGVAGVLARDTRSIELVERFQTDWFRLGKTPDGGDTVVTEAGPGAANFQDVPQGQARPRVKRSDDSRIGNADARPSVPVFA